MNNTDDFIFVVILIVAMIFSCVVGFKIGREKGEIGVFTGDIVCKEVGKEILCAEAK